MKILVIGSGGREHAIVWKLKQSRLVSKIFVTPGNPGIGLMASCVNIKAENINGLADFAQKNKIDLTVVGPEFPLTRGIVDEFTRRKLRIFGPNKVAAEIEGSKAFAKEFMRKYHIPTAPFQIFTEPHEAVSFVRTAGMPIVIKADGLAAGKGAIIVRNQDEAAGTIEKMMVKKVFGEAGTKIIVETFLEGQEVSMMCFTDGQSLKMMLPSQDHKQIGEGDTGPNTGGMGAYCPVPFIDETTQTIIKEHILEPTIAGLKKEGRNYKGVLYAGLMLTESGPKVMEFNCRFGDPETQVVLPLLNSDLADIFVAIVDSNLEVIDDLEWNLGAAACVILASRGYPQKAETGKRIFGLRNYSDRQCFLFHAGTRREGKNWLTAGGRVVGISGVDKDLRSALNRAYEVIDNIKFDGMVFRSDIGFKANMQWKKSRI
ncbi:MAG: phosphoribosylamine--glycine ligase [Candidatus Zixiibacteriota bacterium]|nr:MAG: phosphoribosylamine--glycine ligase [candidate division Zixibacteria bacterium]